MMKNRSNKNKPIYHIFTGSALIVATSLLFLFIINSYVTRLPLWIELSFPFLIGIVSFSVFYYTFEKFINARLQVIYRSIRKGKTIKGQLEKIKITDNVFEKAEEATKKWADERMTEISKLQEQEKFRREFIGNLAHELKTPIFSIQGYILTLLDGGLEDESVNRMFLERASLATERMVHLLEDLDDLNKLEANRMKLDKSNFSLAGLVHEVIDSVELKAKEKEIALQYPSDSAIIVNADRAKIAQVLINLISNSVNYGNIGGRTHVRFYEMNDLVLIEVSDNGPGIDNDELPRIFERFYRVEKSRTRNEGGSGLGLAIAKHIIDSHHQTISARSTVGMGTTFAFTLDLASDEEDNIITTSRGIVIH